MKNTDKNENKNATKRSPLKAKRAGMATSKTVAKDTSNINPEFTDAFIKEVDEEVQNDNFKELWKRYGVFIVALVVVLVSATICFDQLKIWQAKQNQNRVTEYMSALRLQDDNKKTIEELQKFKQKNGGIYGDFANLQIANVLMLENKEEESLAMLQEIINDNQANPEVKNIALIKYASYKTDTMPRDELAKLLQPVIDGNNSWTPIAKDMIAMAAIRDGDVATAKEIYNNLLQNKDLSESYKEKIQNLLSSISDM